MNNYLLNNYNLSARETLQTIFISEYGLRHLEQSTIQSPYQMGHRIIAIIELCPFAGLVATVIEGIVAKLIPMIIQHFYSLFLQNQKKEWLFNGSQIGCYGSVPYSKVEAVWKKLVCHRELGIDFNKEKIVSYLDGGACTAMAFEFMCAYLKLKKVSINSSKSYTKTMQSYLERVGTTFSTCSEEMRIRQAAYNTIEVRKFEAEIDYSKNKIQSLANFHDLKIDFSSQEIDLNTINSDKELNVGIAKLPEGAFMVRILKPANNEKLEEHGHTLIYIKEKGLGLYYDPNTGLRNLIPSEQASYLFKAFKKNQQEFEVHKARFYRINPC
ncbi:MAG: hypothetical protein H0W88_11975 [Parachlamydiaceae bacterium]|nr:hypothetical protein [Parachlamydiaceae bacterium]